MLIFLIGFMGSGKSATARHLQKNMRCQQVDTDQRIERESGMTVDELFRQKGEGYFRTREHAILKAIILENSTLKEAKDEHLVISCGGGTPVFHNNMSLMNAAGLTIYLKVSPKELYKRLSGSKKVRPIFQNMATSDKRGALEKLLLERKPYYQQAGLIIDFEEYNIHRLQTALDLYLEHMAK